MRRFSLLLIGTIFNRPAKLRPTIVFFYPRICCQDSPAWCAPRPVRSNQNLNTESNSVALKPVSKHTCNSRARVRTSPARASLSALAAFKGAGPLSNPPENAAGLKSQRIPIALRRIFQPRYLDPPVAGAL